MAKVGKALESVLEGYAKFLRDRDLAPKHQPRLVRWVQRRITTKLTDGNGAQRNCRPSAAPC